MDGWPARAIRGNLGRVERGSRICAAALLAVALAAGGPACLPFGSRAEAREIAKVRQLAEAFGDYLRWGRLEEAAVFLHPDERVHFLARTQEFQRRLHFTDVEVVHVELSRRGVAHATVAFKVFRPPAVEEVTLLDRQRWQHERGSWYLHFDMTRYLGPPRGRALSAPRPAR